jgi:hypothetical protein
VPHKTCFGSLGTLHRGFAAASLAANPRELIGAEADAMDDTLQRLLDAEIRAEKTAQQAEAERERMIQSALVEARTEEERFEARIPDLHRSFVDKAEARAEQTVAELKKRYDERHAQLRSLAEEREEEALEAAFAIMIDPGAEAD